MQQEAYNNPIVYDHESAQSCLYHTAYIRNGNMITMLQHGAVKRFVSCQSFHTAFAW